MGNFSGGQGLALRRAQGRSGWGAARVGLRDKLTGFEALDAKAILRHIDTRLVIHDIVNPLRPRSTERRPRTGPEKFHER